MMTEDMQLVREYGAQKSETAFETLVSHYVKLVYSTALRQVSDPHLAEEVTQTVFIILARKAGSLGSNTILPGWLYRAACYASADALKKKTRREMREKEFQMEPFSNQSPDSNSEAWAHIASLLDTAIIKLNEKDRNAIVLRFFENKSLSEVANAMGSSESAAKMRVSRGLEKLRKFFIKRGVTLSITTIAGVMAANSVHAAPAGLAATVSATATKGATVTASTTALVNGTLKLMTYAKLKLAIGISAAILVAGGATTVVFSNDEGEGGLSANEIVKRSQERYASLTSYSDNGITVAELNGMKLPTTFTIKLARPDLYFVEWEQTTQFFTNGGAVWSSGEGHYENLWHGGKRNGGRPQRNSDMGTVLSSATGISAGATRTLPATFFHINLGPKGQQFDDSIFWSGKKQADEKVGDFECYVLTRSSEGQTKTLWIGKQDFLIHQVRVVTTPEKLKSVLDEAKKEIPQAPLVDIKGKLISTETHSNIVVNQEFKKEDFIPANASKE